MPLGCIRVDADDFPPVAMPCLRCGVARDASADDIARAFRPAAKRSHPDATDDPAAAEQFKALAAAYTVLSNRRTRRDYDSVRGDGAADVVFRPAPKAAATTPTRWT